MDPQGRVTQSVVVHTNGTCTTTSARTVSRGYLMQSRYVLILYETDINTSPKGQNLMTTINSTEPDLPVSEIRWLFATPTPPSPRIRAGQCLGTLPNLWGTLSLDAGSQWFPPMSNQSVRSSARLPIATPCLSLASCTERCSHHAVQLTRRTGQKLRNAASSGLEVEEERTKGRHRQARRNR